MMPGHGAWMCCRPTWTSSWTKSAPQACLTALKTFLLLALSAAIAFNDCSSPFQHGWVSGFCCGYEALDANHRYPATDLEVALRSGCT